MPSRADYIEGRATAEMNYHLQPFADRPVLTAQCDEGHTLVARYRYWGFVPVCIVCDPEADCDDR